MKRYIVEVTRTGYREIEAEERCKELNQEAVDSANGNR